MRLVVAACTPLPEPRHRTQIYVGGVHIDGTDNLETWFAAKRSGLTKKARL
jgi:hypothetical protein